MFFSLEENSKKLVVSDLPEFTRPTDVIHHFSRFGKVLDAVVKESPRRRVGLVKFSHGSGVDAALAAKSHVISGKTVKIRRPTQRAPDLPPPPPNVFRCFVSGIPRNLREDHLSAALDRLAPVHNILQIVNRRCAVVDFHYRYYLKGLIKSRYFLFDGRLIEFGETVNCPTLIEDPCLLIQGLPENITNELLGVVFGQYGQILEARLLDDLVPSFLPSGRGRRLATVRFVYPSEALRLRRFHLMFGFQMTAIVTIRFALEHKGNLVVPSGEQDFGDSLRDSGILQGNRPASPDEVAEVAPGDSDSDSESSTSATTNQAFDRRKRAPTLSEWRISRSWRRYWVSKRRPHARYQCPARLGIELSLD